MCKCLSLSRQIYFLSRVILIVYISFCILANRIGVTKSDLDVWVYVLE